MQEQPDELQVTMVRSHIEGMLAALCVEAFAHHNYWAWHYVEKIGDDELRSQLQAEVQTAASQKDAEV